MRAALITLLSALALVAAGCGSEDVGAGEASPADMLKPGALVYWETEADPDSDQWEQAEELLRRFPDGEKWLAELRTELDSENVTWPEIREALGGRFGVAVYASSMTDVRVVGLINPDDPAKAVALAEKLNAQEELPEDRLVVRRLDEWVAMSDKAASIDAALKGDGGQALADAEGFKDGMAELDEESLSRVYVDAAAALKVFAGADPSSDKAMRALGLHDIDFAGAWAKARDDGAEVAGIVRGEGADKLLGGSDPYSSGLLDLVPADALAFTSFQGDAITAQLESLRGNPLYGMAVREAERELGVKLEDMLALFKGEVALYAAPGSPIPEITVLLEAQDPEASRRTATELLRKVADDVSENPESTQATFEGVAVHLAPLDGALALTTNRLAIDELEGSGDKLADAERFKDALDGADAPDEYTALTWVDLRETVNLIMGFATTAGAEVPSDVTRNLEPLRSLVIFGEQDGDLGRSLAFVGIE